MPTTVANFNGEKAEETFEVVTNSSFAIINKEELLEDWQAFKRAFFNEKVMMEKKSDSIFARCKRHHGKNMFVYFQKHFK